MVGILSWILGIAWRTALICVGWILVKQIVRNGGGTLREVLETTSLAIRAGCLTLRSKLVSRLQQNAAEQEDVIKENPDVPELKAEGTVR